MFYNGSEEEGRRAFKPFLDISEFSPILLPFLTHLHRPIEPMDYTKEIPYEKLNSMQVYFSPKKKEDKPFTYAIILIGT